MSNFANNRINLTATAAQITAVKTALQTINTNLPFLIGLTKKERDELPSMDVNNKVFTEDALNGVVNNPGFAPNFINITSMQNDLTLFNQLEELLLITSQLCEKIEDTRLLAGSEAYDAARYIYRNVQSQADAGIPGADTLANKLAERYADQGKPKNSPTQPS